VPVNIPPGSSDGGEGDEGSTSGRSSQDNSEPNVALGEDLDGILSSNSLIRLELANGDHVDHESSGSDEAGRGARRACVAGNRQNEEEEEETADEPWSR
jgi:hypothetical protein